MIHSGLSIYMCVRSTIHSGLSTCMCHGSLHGATATVGTSTGHGVQAVRQASARRLAERQAPHTATQAGGERMIVKACARDGLCTEQGDV